MALTSIFILGTFLLFAIAVEGRRMRLVPVLVKARNGWGGGVSMNTPPFQQPSRDRSEPWAGYERQHPTEGDYADTGDGDERGYVVIQPAPYLYYPQQQQLFTYPYTYTAPLSYAGYGRSMVRPASRPLKMTRSPTMVLRKISGNKK